MKTIFNFSHPLGDRAKQQITTEVGDNTICDIAVHLDLEQPLKPQVYKLCDAAEQEFGEPDYLILPGKAEAAYFVARFFSEPQDDYPPSVYYRPVIWLKVDKNKVGREFILGGIE